MIWILRIIPALIVLQTLRYKFTGHPESKEIFQKLELLGLPEKFGRITIGILELIFGVLILIPATTFIGAWGIAILMAGALFLHVSRLGFKGKNLPLALSALAALGVSLYLIIVL